MNACNSRCGFCGRCDDEPRVVVLCDDCRERAVDPDDFAENEARLCGVCAATRIGEAIQQADRLTAWGVR